MEYMIKKEMDKNDKLKRMGWLVAFALAVATLPFLGFVSILIAFIVFLLFVKVIVPATDIEYEYLYCDKLVTVDKILGKKKRKTAGEYKLELMEVVAPKESRHLDNYKNKNAKEVDYSSHIESDEYKTYEVYYAGNIKLFLDLPEEFVKMMMNDAPRKVFLD